VSALFSAVFQKSFMALPVYLSLIPVMGGVAIASATELSFTWLSFTAAMISNVASATRGIFGKSALGNIRPEKNLNAANLYGVMNIMAILMCLPVFLFLEGGKILPTVQALVAAGKGKELLTQTLLSGLYYYFYNEVAFLALDNVAPVTHAIGNTIKRVVIILTSVLVFGTKMTFQGALGSGVAIGGVLLYSLAKNKYQSKK
jgi:solute carrier family 35, member E1